MEEIRDIFGRIACYADPQTGLVENAYKKQVIEAQLPIGGRFTISREGAITIIHRVSGHQIKVDTYSA